MTHTKKNNSFLGGDCTKTQDLGEECTGINSFNFYVCMKILIVKVEVSL